MRENPRLGCAEAGVEYVGARHGLRFGGALCGEMLPCAQASEPAGQSPGRSRAAGGTKGKGPTEPGPLTLLSQEPEMEQCCWPLS